MMWMGDTYTFYTERRQVFSDEVRGAWKPHKRKGGSKMNDEAAKRKKNVIKAKPIVVQVID